jgi:hypothetical protein
MKARKRPFLIHIEPKHLLVLNMTGRYCPACDLIILHQDVDVPLYFGSYGNTSKAMQCRGRNRRKWR